MKVLSSQLQGNVTLLEVRGQLEDISSGTFTKLLRGHCSWHCFIFFFVFFFSKIYSTDSELWDMDLEAT